MKDAAQELGIALPDNLGDVIYAQRFRTPMPDKILATQPEGREWIIELAGRARYRFRLAKENRIVPNPNLAVIRIPDSTPEIIAAYALDDEQALLAIVRYNRLIDTFLGLKNNIAFLREMAIGIIIIVFLVFEPDGLAHRWRQIKAYWKLYPFSH